MRSVRGVTNAVELTRAAARAGTLLVAAVLGSLGCSTGTPGTGDRDAAVDAGAPASRTADAMAPADAGAQSASDATVRPNTSTCMLAASSYDTSCSNDSDCVLAAFGNFCESTCACGNGYINAKGSAQYMADFSVTPLGSGAVPPAQCECPGYTLTGCCQDQTCSQECRP